MTDQERPEDQPLDIAPEGATPAGQPPTARIVAAAALQVAEQAGMLSQALNRGVGRLRRLADAMEADAITLLGIEAEMNALADQLEGLSDE